MTEYPRAQNVALVHVQMVDPAGTQIGRLVI
jgi:hypothetical protein